MLGTLSVHTGVPRSLSPCRTGPSAPSRAGSKPGTWPPYMTPSQTGGRNSLVNELCTQPPTYVAFLINFPSQLSPAPAPGQRLPALPHFSVTFPFVSSCCGLREMGDIYCKY